MLKFELQAILAVLTIVVGTGWVILQNGINKARERGLFDKAKTQLASLAFWQNVFAVIGVFAVLMFLISLISS
jgi:hypothetical protein